jgi:hypothetical protein
MSLVHDRRGIIPGSEKDVVKKNPIQAISLAVRLRDTSATTTSAGRTNSDEK